MYKLIPLILGLSLGAQAQSSVPVSQNLPRVPVIGQLEEVHRFYGQMPVGVAISSTGRTFVSYPRWSDVVNFTLGEIVNGQEVPYPNRALNRYGPGKGIDPATHFVSMQGLVVDAKDRLWVLDSGTINLGKVIGPGAAKLVGIDLKTNKVFKTITFPADVVLPNTYLNDLRVDLSRGAGGAAYITDSGEKSPNGIIVVDLAMGESWRRLSGDKSVKAEDKFVAIVEGKAYLNRPKGGPATYNKTGSDGVAISPDGKRLYYTPNAGHYLYSVSTDALWDRSVTEDAVAATVRNLGQKGVNDGLSEDTRNRVYITDYGSNAITRRLPSGEIETVVRDGRLLWPDTLWIHGGYLYITANQLNRQASHHYGKDRRVKPYSLFRVKLDARPVILK